MFEPHRAPARRRAVPRGTATASVLVLLLAALAGCGGGGGEGRSDTAADTAAAAREAEPASAATAAVASSDCPVIVDGRACAEVEKFADRLAAGEDVSRQDLTGLKDLDAYRILFDGMPPTVNNPQVTAMVMVYAFAPQTEGRSRAAKRLDLVENFRYAHERADSVRSFVDHFARDGLGCRVLDRVRGFVPEERLPSPLTVRFLDAAPEIRYRDGNLLIDASLAIAAGPDVLVNLLSSVLYRDVEQRTGPEPHELTGADCLTAVFDKLAFEGVASWLEDYRNVVFDRDHPQLGRRQKTRLEAYHHALNALNKTNEYLVLLLDDPTMLANRAVIMDELFRGSGAYPVAGFAMADMIYQHEGLSALKACSASPPDFLRAYQKVATAVAAERSAAGTPGSDVDILVPFVEPQFDHLLELMEARGKS